MRILVWITENVFDVTPLRRDRETQDWSPEPSPTCGHDVNPATGLPMLDSYTTDVGGSPYGTDVHSSLHPTDMWDHMPPQDAWSDRWDSGLNDSSYFSSGFHGDWSST